MYGILLMVILSLKLTRQICQQRYCQKIIQLPKILSKLFPFLNTSILFEFEEIYCKLRFQTGVNKVSFDFFKKLVCMTCCSQCEYFQLCSAFFPMFNHYQACVPRQKTENENLFVCKHSNQKSMRYNKRPSNGCIRVS